MKTSKYSSQTYIVIPAFNEASAIGDVIDEIRSVGFENIIVVDDGSLDGTYSIAKQKQCIALKHLINRGKGAATQTGIDAAKLLKAEVVVTVDGDGQNNANDIESLITPIYEEGYDAVLGSRLMTKNEGMPFSRVVLNKIANMVIFFFYGIYVSDSQSGFRAYSRKASKLINTTMDRYEFDSEVLHIIKLADLKFTQRPISVRYTDHSRNKYKELNFQGQNITNGVKMFLKMIIRSIMS
jgi:glycosyltransferase involved in cell wall biosynthesis